MLKILVDVIAINTLLFIYSWKLCASIERQEGRVLTSSLLILRNVVLQLLVLLLQLVINVITLRLLSLKLQNGGSKLEHLVLNLATLQNVSLCSCIQHWLTYLESISLFTRSCLNGGIERVRLSIVGDLIDTVQKVEIGFLNC